MSWEESLGLLNQAVTSPGFTAAYRPTTTHYTFGSFGSSGGRATSGYSWGDLASGRLLPPPVAGSNVTPGSTPVDQNPLQPGAQAGGLDKMQLQFPYVAPSQQPFAQATPQPATKGDILGSVGGALGFLGQQVGLGNAIPFLMERVNTAAHDLADNAFGKAVGAQVFASATDGFISAIGTAADVAGPILDAFPKYVQTQQLNDRAKLYQAVISGQHADFGLGAVSNPLSALGEIESFLTAPGQYGANVPNGVSTNNIAALTGESVTAQANRADYWRKAVLSAVDTSHQLGAQQQLDIIRDSIDLPESVKLQIEAKPDASPDEISKWFDEAPEGRQWSYQGGAEGLVQNLGEPLLFYAAEAKGAEGLGSLAAGAPGPIGMAAQYAGRGLSIAGKLQTGAVAVGAGLTAIDTVFSAVARYAGDDAAVAWFDHALRTTPFSDDPNVQLVTSFSVNPIAAAKLLKKGVLTFKHGAIEAPLDSATRGKLLAHYASADVMLDMVKRMYKLGSTTEAQDLVDRKLGPAAYDQVLNTALDTVIDRLAPDERMAFNAEHPVPAERAAAAVQQFGSAAVDLIRSDPELIATRFHTYDWNYRGMAGPFDADVAADIFNDHSRAAARTYDIRAQRDGAVVGYREYIPPEGQEIIAAQLDRATVDGRVSFREFSDLQRQFPSLGKYAAGILKSEGATSFARADVDRVIDAAKADWQFVARTNPVHARTGRDPILRPDSRTPLRDQADALGTSIETVQAIADAKVSDNHAADLVRRFLVERANLNPDVVNRMASEEVFNKAQLEVERTTRPWREQGQRVMIADAEATRIRSDLARLRALPLSDVRDAAIAEVEKQQAVLGQLVDSAIDPHTPFSAAVVTERAARRFELKLKRMRASTMTEAQRHDVWDYLAGSGAPVTGTDAELLTRAREVAVRPTPEALRQSLIAQAEETVRARQALSTLESLRLYADTIHVGGLQGIAELFTKVEGHYRYSGGLPPISRAMRQRLIKPLQSIGERGLAASMADLSDYDLWRALKTHTERATLIEALTPAQRRMVENVRAIPHSSDTFAATAADGLHGGGGAVDFAGSGGDQTWEETATQLLGERDGILGGQSEMLLRAKASTKIPQAFIDAANAADPEALEAERLWRSGAYVDAEYLATEHPKVLASLRTAIDTALEYPGPDTTAAVRSVVEDNRLLSSQLEASTMFADAKALAGGDPWYGEDTDIFLKHVATELIPADFVPPEAGVPAPVSPIDQAIRSMQPAEVAKLVAENRDATHTIAPLRVARDAAVKIAPQARGRRVSVGASKLLTKLGADASRIEPDAGILSSPANKTGVEVLSVLNHGRVGTVPASVQGVIHLLGEIENGNAARLGISVPFQAEAQRVAEQLIAEGTKVARRGARDTDVVGTFGGGIVHAEEEQALAATLNDVMMFDGADPLGTLQYGIKKAPKDAVVMEWSKIPGLAEELFSERFQPWEERVGTSHLRQAFNYVFGAHSNAATKAAVQDKFTTALMAKGLSPGTAKAAWDRLGKESRESKSFSFIGKSALGREYAQGGWAQYADRWNIPNQRINGIIHGARGFVGVLDELKADGKLSMAEETAARNVDYATVFRESASTVRGTLAQAGPLGQAIAKAYGLAFHNSFATTGYFWFRFGLDARYHAMNFAEAQLLYMGRAGLRNGELDRAMLMGANPEGYLRDLGTDTVSNTGYAFSRDRHHWAYATMVKEQPAALRAGLKGLMSEDPAAIKGAIEQIAKNDPQLRDMIDVFDGGKPDAFLKALDDWHTKMLANVDGVADAKVIDQALAEEMAKTPELAQVFAMLGKVNTGLWDDIRKTFYGDPDRSRAERFLNHYLLFWPLSYQVKTTKWFLKILGDRAGGLPTNAAGAVIASRLAETHQRLLATDPEYSDWFEKHKTLVFFAQMLLPLSLDETGVSLSPPMRALFFERQKNWYDIGPIYTLTDLLPNLAREGAVDFHRSLGELPLADDIYRTVTSVDPEKAAARADKKATAKAKP